MQKKIIRVIQEVADEENVSFDVVKQIYLSTFTAVEKALRKFKNVRVLGLGSFVINWGALRKPTKLTKRFAQDERTKAARDRVGWQPPKDLPDE